MKVRGLLMAAVVVALIPACVLAGLIPYGNAGTVNPESYQFVACSDSIDVYFYGSDASYGSWLGLEVNNLSQGSHQLYNHGSFVGQMVTMSGFNVGDLLVFTLEVSLDDNQTVDYSLYSDESANDDGLQHIYSTGFSGTLGSVTLNNATYIGWEDKLAGDSPDWDYNDHQFVFTGVCAPDGGTTVTLMGLGLLGLSALRRKFS